MPIIAAIAGTLLLFGTLFDVFENIILPRRMQGRFQLTAIFYRWSWKPWAAAGRRISDGRMRERFLSFYGPLSLLALFALWALSVVVAFGLLQWSAGLQYAPGHTSIFDDFFLSSTSFFSLTAAPAHRAPTRFLMMLESALGFGFLGLLISYLPTLYQSFSRREVGISMLDERAGSPATAAVLLVREGRNLRKLDSLLQRWEEWSAELLETNLSYPALAYFRSHHNNQSWLSSVTAILDASALLTLAQENETLHQAQLTFAMARHALVDMDNVFRAQPRSPCPDRLP
ncbi:MAG TPA: two pore domain potassium channel family protein, partial [Terriglobales bacterium]|nr:two pore domain potassium channel family protein [Terriglobales bacterium]